MGFLRGAAKGISGFIFIIIVALLVMNITLYEATTPAFIRPLFLTIFSKSIASQDITSTYNEALNKCQTQTSYNPPMGNLSVTLDCSEVKPASKDDFSKLIAEALFDQQLYGRSCTGFDCLQMKDLPGFATQAFNLFLKTTLLILAASTIIFGLFLVLLSRGWPSKLSSLGVPLVLNGLPGVFLEFYKTKIQMGDFQIFIDSIIALIIRYMLISLALGIVLIAVSIFIKGRLKGKVKKGKNNKNNKKGKK